jgi:hypothetical protein
MTNDSAIHRQSAIRALSNFALKVVEWFVMLQKALSRPK